MQREAGAQGVKLRPAQHTACRTLHHNVRVWDGGKRRAPLRFFRLLALDGFGVFYHLNTTNQRCGLHTARYTVHGTPDSGHAR